jgi:hypothetical protein
VADISLGFLQSLHESAVIITLIFMFGRRNRVLLYIHLWSFEGIYRRYCGGPWQSEGLRRLTELLFCH